jgi:hypothetical protein
LDVYLTQFMTKMIWKTIGCNGFHPASFWFVFSSKTMYYMCQFFMMKRVTTVMIIDFLICFIFFLVLNVYFWFLPSYISFFSFSFLCFYKIHLY